MGVSAPATTVLGSVIDTHGDLEGWQLRLVPISVPEGSSEDPFVIATSTTEAIGTEADPAVLGTIQPDLLDDGLYQIELIATAHSKDENGTQVPDFDRGRVVPGHQVLIQDGLHQRSFDQTETDIAIDVPGLPLITLGRYYNSSEADNGVDNGLGIGWALAMPEVRIVRIADLVESQETSAGLRGGDIVTALIPGKGALSFAFAPKVIDDTTPGAEIWEPQFVSVDGSGSVLGFNWDDSAYQLIEQDGEFFVQELGGLQRTIAYDPADSELASSYLIATVDEWVYGVDFTSGLITSATDPQGNTVTYSESGIAAGDQTIHIEREAETGRVLWLSTDASGVEPKVIFGYDQTTGDLTTVTDREGRTTYYTYDTDHRLTSVTDANGVEQIAVGYEADGRVSSIGRLATNDEPGVVPEGAEHVYNERRELTRIIQAQYDNLGAVTSYTVVAFTYEYAELDDSDFESVYRSFDRDGVTYRYTETATIQTAKQTAWLPFEINGADPDGLRYTQAPTVKTGEMTLRAWPSGFDGTDLSDLDHLGMPTQQAVLAPDGKTWLLDTAEYEHFTNQATQVTDAYGNTVVFTYDDAGNLIEEKRVAPDGTTILEHLKHVYTTEGLTQYTYVLDGSTVDVSALASGLWLESLRVLDEVSSAEVSLGRDVYYDAAAPQGSVGRLYLVTDRDEVSSRYTYWGNGNVKEIFREWTDSSGSHSVLESYTEYNEEGQVTLVENVFGDESQYHYDATGRTFAIQDRYGAFTLYTYDARGNLIRRVVSRGTDSIETRWVYDDDNLLTYVSEGFLSESAFTFSLIDPGQGVAWDTTDSQSLGNNATYAVTEYLYDSLDRRIGSVRHDNASIQIALDIDPVIDTAIAPAGLQIFEAAVDLSAATQLWDTSIYYDYAGRTTQTVGATGLRRGTIYNDAGFAVVSGVLKDTAPLPDSGTALTLSDFENYAEFRYDQWNQDSIVLDGTPEVGDVITLTFHNRPGDQSATVSVTVATPADAMSDLAAAINSSADPLIAQITNAVVDAVGNIQLTLDPTADFLLTADISDADAEGDAPLIYADGTLRSTWSRDTNGHTTLDIMNEQGQVVKTVYHDGSFVETPVDTLGKPVSQADLDTPSAIPSTELDGTHTVSTVQRKLTDPVLAQHSLYDGSGNLSDVWLPQVVDPVAASPTYNTLVRPHYHYEYDSRGNVLAITDPNYNRTEFTYDTLGRQTSRTLPIGVATTGDPADFVDTRHFVDAAIDQLTGDLSLSVGSGQLAYAVDFEGRVTAYRYDNSATGRGRLAGTFYYDTEADYLADTALTAADRTATYAYNAFGQMTQVNDSGHGSGGGVTDYGYDSRRRLTQIASPEGILNYAYNDLGQTTRVWTSKTTAATDAVTDIQYTYDLYGRLETVTTVERADVAVANAGDTTAYHYDGVGNLDAQTVENGTSTVTTDYQYDALNRLVYMVHFDDLDADLTYDDTTESLYASFEYTLDSRGNRVASAETVDDGTTTHTYDYTWQYDNANRLIGEQLDASNNALDYTDTYTYDLAGSRIGKTHDQASDGSIDLTTVYGHDANDRLVVEQGFSNNGSTLETTTVYAYGTNADYTAGALYGGDATTLTEKTIRVGSFTSGSNFASRQTFTYGVNGRVAETKTYTNGSTTPDATTTYTYDHSGLRVSETTGTGTKDYLFDPRNPTGFAQVLEEYVNATLEKVYQLGHDVIQQTDVSDPQNQDVYTLLGDGHGSTRALLDDLNAVAQQFAYDAYGQMLEGTALTTAANALTNLLYSGEWTNSNGQQYLRARMYDPSSGTFNRLDPYAGNLSDPQSLHKYLYTHANPVAFSDPSGQFIEVNWFAANMAVGITSIGLGFQEVLNAQQAIKNDPSVENFAYYGVAVTTWIFDTLLFMSGFSGGNIQGGGALAIAHAMTFQQRVAAHVASRALGTAAGVLAQRGGFDNPFDNIRNLFDNHGSSSDRGGPVADDWSPPGSNSRKGEKRGPKPKGEGPHNQTIERRIEELQEQLGPDWEHIGGGSRTEVTVQTPGGSRNSRRTDITFRNRRTGEIYHEQVGRTNADGTPVTRETEALDDIENQTGTRPEFTPYD